MADNKKKAHQGDFFTVEAYKIARTNISLSIFKQGCKKILITSSLANEGKTTTSCNIAAAFSKQMNSKTLLIDCDLRKPSVAKFFRIKNAPGVTNYLSGMCSLDEIIQQVPNTDLNVITSGIIPPNPSELLSSVAFADMVAELEKRYDYIIFDTTPLNVVIDALPIAKLVDGVALVVFEDKSNYGDVEKAVSSLNRCGAHFLGFILNGSKYRGSISKNKKTYR